MREDILDAIDLVNQKTLKDIQVAFNLPEATRAYIKKMALADEEIAEYLLLCV